MKEPTQCALWSKPERVNGPTRERFELVRTFADESHLLRYLLKCRECGQLYFFEFYEEVDWVDGDDPQYSTYIPVETDAEIETLKAVTHLGLLQFTPRLQQDYPKGARGPTLRWVK